MKTSLVITTISAPTRAMHEFAAESKRRGIDFIVIGDSISPPDFVLDGCDYYSVDHQLKTGFQYAGAAPLRHYARKNIGYLVSIANGTDIIVESDDDNYPLPGFWSERRRIQQIWRTTIAFDLFTNQPAIYGRFVVGSMLNRSLCADD